MPSLGLPEIIIIAVVLLVLFGFKKLPDAARSLGRSMRIMKSEINEMKKEGEPTAEAKPEQPAAINSDQQPTITIDTASEAKNKNNA